MNDFFSPSEAINLSPVVADEIAWLRDHLKEAR